MATTRFRQPVTKVIDEGGITLDLSIEEATNLFAVLSRVSTGSDFDTFPIYEALSKTNLGRPRFNISLDEDRRLVLFQKV